MFDFLGDAWGSLLDGSIFGGTPDAPGFSSIWQRALAGGDKIPAPPPPPDLTDTAVQQARLSARRRALLGAGIGSTFLSGPLGDLAPPPTQSTSLGGV